MEQRLIDADALKKALCKVCGMRHYCKSHDDDCWAKRRIDEQPTVDAVPVRYGEWSNRRTWTHDGEWYCTACDKEITIYMGEKRGNDRYKYCPNCGAIMDGEQDV